MRKTSRMLGDNEFCLFKKLITGQSGMSFGQGQRDRLALLLDQRLESLKLATYADYFHYLQTSESKAKELRTLVNLLTIQETSFFRYPSQFQVIRHIVLPEIMEAKEKAGGRRIRMWSAACSTGEEPYSLAMAVLESGINLKEWDIQILATDINTDALKTAERGIYNKKRLAKVNTERQRRFFRKETSGYQIKKEVKELVEFSQLNLLEPDSLEDLRSTIDIILCCNVLIYFDRKTTEAVLKDFFGRLGAGGYLFLGHAESLWGLSQAFDLVDIGDVIVYRKRKQEEPQPEPVTRPIDEILDSMDEQNFVELMKPMPTPETTEAPHRGEAIAKEETGTSEPSPALSSDVRDQLAGARKLVAGNELDEASQELSNIVDSEPLCSEAYLMLGDIYAREGKYRQAITELQRSIYCDHNLSLSHFYLAQIFEALGLIPAALREYQNTTEAADKDKREWEAYLEGFTTDTLADFCRAKVDKLKQGGQE